MGIRTHSDHPFQGSHQSPDQAPVAVPPESRTMDHLSSHAAWEPPLTPPPQVNTIPTWLSSTSEIHTGTATMATMATSTPTTAIYSNTDNSLTSDSHTTTDTTVRSQATTSQTQSIPETTLRPSQVKQPSLSSPTATPSLAASPIEREPGLVPGPTRNYYSSQAHPPRHNAQSATDRGGGGGHESGQGGATTSSVSPYHAERPTGVPRCIVRIDRDHNLGDEATRFECEQFPEEFLGRVTRPEFKRTVEGVNDCMRNAEESLLNCLDTLLDCLSAYTAKHCCGTHYQRAMRRMEGWIEQENRQLYHPARMHLRNPQTVGMIYLEFEIF